MKQQRVVISNGTIIAELAQVDNNILHQAVDIYVENGIITAVEQHSEKQDERFMRVDATNCYISAGWIDMHVHAFKEHQPYGDDIDEIGVAQGVTTVVDAGSCGADQIDELYAIGQAAQTRLLAFLNVSRIGLRRIDELTNLEWINESLVAETCHRYDEFVVGLKARISKTVVEHNGVKPLAVARRIADNCNQRLMVHIGSGPPEISEVLPLLSAGDIITHFLHGKANNLFTATGEPIPALVDARERGVQLDVGHGSASFSFRVAEAAKRHGIYPDTISSDIYRVNRKSGPVYSLAHVLSKFLYLDYTLEEVIAAVTSKPANWLGRVELSELKVGSKANLTIFAVEQQKVELIDSTGDTREAEQLIIPKGVMINDRYITC